MSHFKVLFFFHLVYDVCFKNWRFFVCFLMPFFVSNNLHVCTPEENKRYF